MRAKMFLVTGIMLLLLPVVLLEVANPVAADEGLVTEIKFPGPYGPYEKNVVTVACGQISPVNGDTVATLGKIKNFVTKAAEKGANIIVFPEHALNNRDYDNHPEMKNKDVAEVFPGPSSMEVAKLTQKYGVYVVYGFVERDNLDASKIYNSAAIIGPKGIIGVYRKIHPGVIEDVDRGHQPVAFNTPWGPVGVAICLDTYAYPELTRTYAMMGARLLVNPTNMDNVGGLPETMKSQSLCRSWEDYIYVATCNNVGHSRGDLYHGGQSFIMGPKGMSFMEPYFAGPASPTEEEMIMATIDLRGAETLRGYGKAYETCPRQGEPLFLPQLWASLWSTNDEELATKKQELEAKNNEIEALKTEKAAASQNFYIAAAVAGVLLISTIALAIVVARKKRK